MPTRKEIKCNTQSKEYNKEVSDIIESNVFEKL